MTYSKYNHGFNQGVITESFDSIIKNELTRIKIRQNEPQLIINNPNFDNNVDSNYLRHGNYVYYLKKWLELFPRKQLHILTNEQLTNNPIETMEKVLADINKIIIDKNAGSGVVPYLPLQELKTGTN